MLEGVVNVLKPPGLTSSDVVTDLRRIFSMKRVGHTGTLDPGAAGVLPVCIGRATRLFDYLVDKDKEYLGKIHFGTATDTQDSYGLITERLEKTVTEAEFLDLLRNFHGEQDQEAPIYSAVKQGGKKLYQLAREGREIEPKIRRICLYDLELIQNEGINGFLFKVCCSRGTYVRTICYDMGRALGVPAHLSFLLRTRAGHFTIQDAYTIGELQELKEAGALASAVTTMERALMDLEELRLKLPEREEKLLKNGVSLAWPSAKAGIPYKIYCNGSFLGIGKMGEEGVHICTYLCDDQG